MKYEIDNFIKFIYYKICVEVNRNDRVLITISTMVANNSIQMKSSSLCKRVRDDDDTEEKKV